MKTKNNSNKLLAMSLSVVLLLVLATMAIIFLSNKVNSEVNESIGNDYFTTAIKKHNESMNKLKQERIQDERKKEIARIVAERKKREALAKKKEQERLARIAKLEKERQAERERLNKIAIAKAEEKRVASLNNKNKNKTSVSRSSNYKGDNVNLGTFNVSAYGSDCYKCSGVSASGVDLRGITSYKGHGIAAADWSVIPPYSIIEVQGHGTFIVLDTGGKIKQKKLDLLMGSEAQSKSFGRQNLNVTVIKWGNK